MPSFFSKTATPQDIRRQLAEEQRKLEENGGRQAAHRAEETLLLEEGDRAAIAAFRKRTANLLQELSDDAAIATARIHRLEAELVEALERKETSERQAVIDRRNAAFGAMVPIYPKLGKQLRDAAKTLENLQQLYQAVDEADRLLLAFDEADASAGRTIETTWRQRADSSADLRFLAKDENGDSPLHPAHADITIRTERGALLWRAGRSYPAPGQ